MHTPALIALSELQHVISRQLTYKLPMDTLPAPAPIVSSLLGGADGKTDPAAWGKATWTGEGEWMERGRRGELSREGALSGVTTAKWNPN
jgi:hypothetical protein